MPEPVKRWHWHRWTEWGKPFQFTNSAYIVFFQDRSCTRCNKRGRRTV